MSLPLCLYVFNTEMTYFMILSCYYKNYPMNGNTIQLKPLNGFQEIIPSFIQYAVSYEDMNMIVNF